MSKITFNRDAGRLWTQVLYSGDQGLETVGYIQKEEKYFETVNGGPIFDLVDLEEIVAEMKKL